MAESIRNSSSRSDRPSLLSPGKHEKTRLPSPSPIKQSSTEQDEENLSKETLKSFEVQQASNKDATTPMPLLHTVLPPLPRSPLLAAGEGGEDGPSPLRDSAYGSNQDTEQEQPNPNYFKHERRAGSQRQPGKYRKALKSNTGIVVGDFNGLYPDELSLKVGEEIEIISKDTAMSRNIGWWTGRNKTGKLGIFPAACVSCDIQGKAGVEVPQSEYPLEIKNSEVEMKEVIGIGGFGKVFRALYKGEEVAVKVAKATTFDSLRAVQDVISEAEKFAHLAHINICALVGVVLVKDVCLVMEYAKGGALSDVLHKRNISLPVDVITDWTAQIASGMHYLHHEAEPSLIHRDLKTSNSEFF